MKEFIPINHDGETVMKEEEISVLSSSALVLKFHNHTQYCDYLHFDV